MGFSWRRDAVEIATAFVLAGLVLRTHGTSPAAMLLLYLAAVSPALCIADLTERRLPNRLVLPGYLVAGVAALIAGASELPFFPLALLSAIAYSGFLLALAALGGMGMGDVKLAGVLGCAAGSVGITSAILSPVLAFAIGAIAAVVTLVHGRGRSIPFGPCLIAGFWCAVLGPFLGG